MLPNKWVLRGLYLGFAMECVGFLMSFVQGDSTGQLVAFLACCCMALTIYSFDDGGKDNAD